LRFVQGESAELETGQRLLTMCTLERCRKTLRRLAWAECDRVENRRDRRPAHQRAEQLDRSGVGPVKVVQNEHERSRLRELFEQRTHRSVRAVALVLQCDVCRARERRQGGEDVPEIGEHIPVEDVKPVRLEALHVLVDRVDQHGERQVALQLRT
jgi:hypothetical protein